MDLRQLRYVVAVADERSITRAAARLHLTQPPLSAQVARLEHELGVPLLVRHRRGVDLTEAGRLLVERARAILADVDAAVDEVRRTGQGRSGRLTLAVTAATAWTVLPAVLRRFTPTGRESPSRSGRAAPTTSPSTSGPAAPISGCCTCPRRAPARAPTSTSPSSAANRSSRCCPGNSHLLGACRLSGVTPDLREVELVQTVVALVGAGVGVSVLPAAVATMCGPDAVTRPLARPVPVVETALVRRRADPPTPPAAHFLRLALDTPEPDALGPAYARPHL